MRGPDWLAAQWTRSADIGAVSSPSPLSWRR